MLAITLAVLLILASAACAGNAVLQGISMSSDGGQISQSAAGSQITQSGANALAVLGDDNQAGQQVTQAAFGQNIFQNGWNTGSITGDGNTLVQGLLSYAQTYADTNQTMSNTAYIEGSYNQVNQQVAGVVLMGSSDAAVNQMGSNFGQTLDQNGNRFEQKTKLKSKAGRGSKAAQFGKNEVRIGPG